MRTFSVPSHKQYNLNILCYVPNAKKFKSFSRSDDFCWKVEGNFSQTGRALQYLTFSNLLRIPQSIIMEILFFTFFLYGMLYFVSLNKNTDNAENGTLFCNCKGRGENFLFWLQMRMVLQKSLKWFRACSAASHTRESNDSPGETNKLVDVVAFSRFSCFI